MSYDSLNAKLAIEKGLYLASQGKTADEATTAALRDLSLIEKGSLIVALRPHMKIQVFGNDPEKSITNQNWIDEQAREALSEEISSLDSPSSV